jgi:hypothetical protein
MDSESAVSDAGRRLLAALIIAGLLAGPSPAANLRAQGTAARQIAPTLLRPPAATKAPDADGFLQRWLILDPIRLNAPLTDSAVQMAVKAEYFPNQFTTLPRDGDALTVADTALTWRAVETVNYNVNLYHFAYAHKRPTSNVLFWVVTVVNAPRDMPDVRLAIGSNAASVWWVNGQEVIGIYNDRQTVIDDGVSKRLTLKKGANVIRGAIVNGGGATDFCARIIDGDDRPIRDITVGLSVPERAAASPAR